MEKFTKGPWSKRGPSNVVQSSEGNTIADVRYKNGGNDAHLIAAAPDLYQALEDMIDAVEYLNDGEENKETLNARRALAKARGEYSK